MSDTWQTLGPENDNDESSQQPNHPLPAILIGVICIFGIMTNGVIVYRVVMTYIKTKESIHAADMYVFHKAIFDLFLLMSSPCYVISVWNGQQLYLFPLQCRILVSTDFLAILLSNHVTIGLVFERYGRRIKKSGKPIIISREDTNRHFQANVLYSLLFTVAIVFVGDGIVWRGIPSCGYDWPVGQNYHAVTYAFLFVIVYCISYFLFIYWALDLLKQHIVGPRQEILVPSEKESRRDKVAIFFLLINFCCWTPFWCYHIYVMVHYYQIRPSIHIPGGFHTDEILVSTMVYLSASTNIIPCALFIKDWAPRFWLKTLNAQSNVMFLQVNPALRQNQNGLASSPRNHHAPLPDYGHHQQDFGGDIEMHGFTLNTNGRENNAGNGVKKERDQIITSLSLNNTLGIGVPSTSC